MVGFETICSEFDQCTQKSFEDTVHKSWQYWEALDQSTRSYLNEYYVKEINKLCQPFIDFELRFS
jgi:poly-D-alanine transfer protein DltD